MKIELILKGFLAFSGLILYVLFIELYVALNQDRKKVRSLSITTAAVLIVALSVILVITHL